MTGRALTPVTDRWLGEPLPHQLPNQAHAHPKPPELLYKYDAIPISYGVLISFSEGYSPVWGKLRTCSAPACMC